MWTAQWTSVARNGKVQSRWVFCLLIFNVFKYGTSYNSQEQLQCTVKTLAVFRDEVIALRDCQRDCTLVHCSFYAIGDPAEMLWRYWTRCIPCHNVLTTVVCGTGWPSVKSRTAFEIRVAIWLLKIEILGKGQAFGQAFISTPIWLFAVVIEISTFLTIISLADCMPVGDKAQWVRGDATLLTLNANGSHCSKGDTTVIWFKRDFSPSSTEHQSVYSTCVYTYIDLTHSTKIGINIRARGTCTYVHTVTALSDLLYSYIGHNSSMTLLNCVHEIEPYRSGSYFS